jgi:hypothetical protein
MRMALRAAITLAAGVVLFVSACGGGGESSSCAGGTPTNSHYLWTCTSNCPDVAELDITSQAESTVSGSITLCTGTGACPMLCDAGANSENSFTGTVSGNCIDLSSTDGTWAAHGIVTGNTMQFTINSGAGNCYGAQSRTVTLGH